MTCHQLCSLQTLIVDWYCMHVTLSIPQIMKWFQVHTSFTALRNCNAEECAELIALVKILEKMDSLQNMEWQCNIWQKLCEHMLLGLRSRTSIAWRTSAAMRNCISTDMCFHRVIMVALQPGCLTRSVACQICTVQSKQTLFIWT